MASRRKAQMKRAVLFQLEEGEGFMCHIFCKGIIYRISPDVAYICM